jgi:hypothetical protein
LIIEVFVRHKIVGILGELTLVDILVASMGRNSSEALQIFLGVRGGFLPDQEGISPHHRLQLPVALFNKEGVEAAELDKLAKVDIDVREEHE